MEYTTTPDGELATVEVKPVDWASLYRERNRLEGNKASYCLGIDDQIAVIDAVFAEAQTRGVVIPQPPTTDDGSGG